MGWNGSNGPNILTSENFIFYSNSTFYENDKVKKKNFISSVVQMYKKTKGSFLTVIIQCVHLCLNKLHENDKVQLCFPS